MSNGTRPHMQRYRDRLAHEEVGASLGMYPWVGLVVAGFLTWQAVFRLTGWEALLSASLGAVAIGVFWGLRRADDWTRLAIGFVGVAGLGANLWLWGAHAPEYGPADHFDRALYAALATWIIVHFFGPSGREQFARARRHVARRDLERAEARAIAHE